MAFPFFSAANITIIRESSIKKEEKVCLMDHGSYTMYYFGGKKRGKRPP